MKFLWFVFLFVVTLGIIFIASHFFSGEKLTNIVTPVVKETPSPTTAPVSLSTALFVPYWTIGNTSLDQQYNSYLYFGITANDSGINTTEPGYLHVNEFSHMLPGKEKILVLRLLDQKTSDALFADTSLKQKIIQQAIAIAKKYNFSAVAIDLEYSSLAFTSVTQNVSSVITDFSGALQKQNLRSFVTIYGDTFYRVRPFNVKQIAQHVDGIFVMAYDFHKAKGNPGPNFPLEMGEDESYSFKQMVNDFLLSVPKEKLTIIFGMFGYDWKVSDKGTSVVEGDPKSTADIEKLFVTSCSQKNCVQTRNAAGEPSVSYIDSNESKHIIWYEDAMSIKKKIEYLQTKGIGNTALWANSYF